MWNTSRLLLALPQSSAAPKSKVKLVRFTGHVKLSAVIKWIYNIMGDHVRHFDNGSELSVWMHRSCAVADVCFLLVSSLTLPPFFLSALSVKFSGRVKFATSTVDAAVASGLPLSLPTAGAMAPSVKKVTMATTKQPRQPRALTAPPPVHRGRMIAGRYWMLAPQGTIEYGGSPDNPWLGSRLTYRSVYSWLRWFVPDLNDMFLFSLAITNLCVVASLFDLRASPIQAILHFAWSLIKYNFMLLLIWLVIISLSNRSVFISAAKLALGLWRRLSVTYVGRLLLDDTRWLAQHTYFTIVTFAGFSGIVYFFRRRYWPQSLEEPEPLSEYFRLPFRPVIVFNPGRPTMHLYNYTRNALNPKVRVLIRQLGLDEYSVHPGVDYDFLLNLPVWRHLNNDINVSPPIRPCVRCKCVRALNMQRMAQKLKVKPCRRCGYSGQLGCSILSGVNCAICLDIIHTGDVICGLPCTHAYHQSCIVSWLLTDPGQTCPCCRWPAYVQRTEKKMTNENDRLLRTEF